jgi:hypothetical protein
MMPPAAPQPPDRNQSATGRCPEGLGTVASPDRWGNGHRPETPTSASAPLPRSAGVCGWLLVQPEYADMSWATEHWRQEGVSCGSSSAGAGAASWPELSSQVGQGELAVVGFCSWPMQPTMWSHCTAGGAAPRHPSYRCCRRCGLRVLPPCTCGCQAFTGWASGQLLAPASEPMIFYYANRSVPCHQPNPLLLCCC